MLENLGLFGLFLGCFLSATVIPFSSEALLAGALVMLPNPWMVVWVAGLGNTLGGLVSFLLATATLPHSSPGYLLSATLLPLRWVSCA